MVVLQIFQTYAILDGMNGPTIEIMEFLINKEKLGHVLGPIKYEGNEIAQAILTSGGKVIPRCTTHKLCEEELYNPIEVTKH